MGALSACGTPLLAVALANFSERRELTNQGLGVVRQIDCLIYRGGWWEETTWPAAAKELVFNAAGANDARNTGHGVHQ